MVDAGRLPQHPAAEDGEEFKDRPACGMPHAHRGLTEHGIQEVWWLVVGPLHHRERPAAHVRELAATGREVGSCDLPRPEILPYSGPLPVTGQRKHNYL